MLRKLDNITYQYKTFIIGVWVLFFVVSIFFAIKLPSRLIDPPFQYEHSESKLGTDLIQKQLHVPVSTIFIVVEDKSYRLNSSSDQIVIRSLTNELQKLNNVTDVRLKLDKHIGYITVGFKVDQEQVVSELSSIRKIIQKMRSQSIHFSLTGDAAFVEQEQYSSVNDLKHIESIALPLTLCILLLAFSSWVAALLPLVVGVISAMISLAVVFGLSHIMQFSTYVLNVPTTMGIAIGIDYSLLLVSRFKEELKISNTKDSVIQTLNLSGRSILISGIVVILGLCTGFFFDSSVIRSVMLGGSIVIFITMLCALTLLPALLGVLGKNIEKGKLFQSKRHNHKFGWERFSEVIMRYSKVSIFSSMIVLIIMIVPLKHLAFEIPGVESLPKSFDSRSSMEKLYNHFGKTEFSPITILFKATNGNIDTEQLNQYSSWIRSLPNVQSVSNGLNNKQYGVFTVILSVDPSNNQAKEVIESIRLHSFVGYKVYVTGLLASHYDFDQHILDRLPTALAYILVTTFVLLMLSFRSILIPLKAIFMNTLSLLATFGTLTWIFIDGHLLWLFHVDSANPIDSFVPVFIFGFLFGTSMDYEVFMLSRIKEEYKRGLSNDKATAKGLSVTARMITYVALVLIIHMSSFAITEVLPVKQIGIGLALAILIDSTIVRLVLVPALMKLFGDWNWKLPEIIDKRLPKIDV